MKDGYRFDPDEIAVTPSTPYGFRDDEACWDDVYGYTPRIPWGPFEPLDQQAYLNAAILPPLPRKVKP